MLNEVKHLAQKQSEILRCAQNDNGVVDGVFLRNEA